MKRKAFRDAFVSSRVSQMLALQIRLLRQREGLTQAELACKLGTSQNAVFRLENPGYGKASITTLKKLASFFDVGLAIRFTSFSDSLDWALSLKQDAVLVPKYEADIGMVEAKEIGMATAANRFIATPASAGPKNDYTVAPSGDLDLPYRLA